MKPYAGFMEFGTTLKKVRPRVDPTHKAAAVLLLRRLTHPRTAGRALACVGRGLSRSAFRWWSWIKVDDKPWLVGEGSSKHDHVIQDRYAQMRRTISWAGAVVILTAWSVVGLVYGATGLLTLALVMSTLFALVGRPVASSVLVEKEAVPHAPVLDGDTLRQIVASATIGMRPEAWREIRVLGPGVVWDAEHIWWSLRLEMPGVVPGSAVQAARTGILSGLAIGNSQLIIKVDPSNEGIVTLAGTLTDPWAKPAQQTPMMKDETRSVWDPIPVATDAQGRAVLVSLLFTGWIIGAIPRMGKTNLGRLLALAVALDVDADLAVFDLKGAADWRMFKTMAVQFGLGRTPRALAALHDYLLEVQHEVNRRAEIIGDLELEECPEGQLTQALAQDEDLGMRPLAVFIDEVHRAFLDPVWGTKIADVIEDIAKNAQFVGVVLVLMTQKPDSKAIPTRIRDVLGTRAAGKCMTRHSSEAILGTEAHGEGYNAAALPKRAGVFMFYGTEDSSSVFDALTVRVDRCDVAQAAMVAERATNARGKARRLPTPTGGDATPADDEVPALIVHAQALQADEPFIPSEDLLARLNEMPEYAGAAWNPTSLGRALRTLGYPSFPASALRGRRAFDFTRPPSFPAREQATGTDGRVVILGNRSSSGQRRVDKR